MSDIILDFQSINFERDSILLSDVFMEYINKFRQSKMRGYSIRTEPDDRNLDNEIYPNSEKPDGVSPEYVSSLFKIIPSHYIAGWSFAKLTISSDFLFDILRDITASSETSKNNLDSDKLFKSIPKYKSLGKQYFTSDYKLIMFIIWVNDKLKCLKSNSFVKVGEKMAESSVSGGFLSGASFTGTGIGGGTC